MSFSPWFAQKITDLVGQALLSVSFFLHIIKCGKTRQARLPALLFYFAAISTEARVVSQSSLIAQPLPLLSNAIVKFSTIDGVLDAFMSTRTKSESAPG